MIETIMRHLNNFFSTGKTEQGDFVIDNQIINAKNKYLAGTYIAISGSLLSDGIYEVIDDKITLTGSKDEEFRGQIYQLAPNREFLRLVKEIEDFTTTPTGVASNVTSSSFGIKSTSFATTTDGMRAGWQDVYKKQLSKYRRYTPDIEI